MLNIFDEALAELDRELDDEGDCVQTYGYSKEACDAFLIYVKRMKELKQQGLTIIPHFAEQWHEALARCKKCHLKTFPCHMVNYVCKFCDGGVNEPK